MHTTNRFTPTLISAVSQTVPLLKFPFSYNRVKLEVKSSGWKHEHAGLLFAQLL